MRRLFAYMGVLILLLFAATGCQRHHAERIGSDLVRIQSETGKASKKVIFLLVDSLMPKQIDQGMANAELPTFRRLIEQGQYYKDVVSSFPTMSVSIDSALLTGAYPDRHRVPGLAWYSSKERRVVNYGTGPTEVIKQGVNSTLIDGIIRLNGSHLNPKLPTIYEDLAKQDKTAGSINGLIYRGTNVHRLSVPAWLHTLTAFPAEVTVKGPDFLALGSLAKPLEGEISLPDGVKDRFGINNDYSIQTLNYLIDTNSLPDFLLVYLPDLDQKLHKKGTDDLSGIKKVDEQLQSLLTKLDSRKKEQHADDIVLMIAGDSGMTQLLTAEQDSVVDLPTLLGDYQVLMPGAEVTDKTEIVLAVNETMAYLYKLKSDKKLSDIAYKLGVDSRIDFIAWKEKDWIRVMRGQGEAEFQFKPGGTEIDRYKQAWTIRGDPAVLDIKVAASKHSMEFGQYPDALMRLYGALNSHEGQFLVLTSMPGYELADRSSPTHEGGGGHGALGRQESLVPLILYGTDRKPKFLRIIDLKPFILSLLNEE